MRQMWGRKIVYSSSADVLNMLKTLADTLRILLFTPTACKCVVNGLQLPGKWCGWEINNNFRLFISHLHFRRIQFNQLAHVNRWSQYRWMTVCSCMIVESSLYRRGNQREMALPEVIFLLHSRYERYQHRGLVKRFFSSNSIDFFVWFWKPPQKSRYYLIEHAKLGVTLECLWPYC